MKRFGIFLVLMSILIIAAAPTASACWIEIVNISADCESYTISVEGTTYVGLAFTANYTVILASASGSETITGSFDIPYDPPASSPDGKDFARSFIGYWTGPLCGTYTVSGSIELVPITTKDYPTDNEVFGPVTVVCDCPSDGPGTGTPGYWKNHPEAWPVEEITIGGVTYSKADAIATMQSSVSTDKTFTMFDALVAAKLNVMIGNESSCIDATIAAADAWMAAYGPAGSGVEAGGDDSPWRDGEELYEMLDAYNNGELCAKSRDELEEEGSGKIALKAPGEFSLAQNFPNPFNPTTTIEFTLPSESNVSLTIYNSVGTKVATLVNRHYSAGRHAIEWNASEYSSGVYFYRLNAGKNSVVRKLTLMK